MPVHISIPSLTHPSQITCKCNWCQLSWQWTAHVMQCHTVVHIQWLTPLSQKTWKLNWKAVSRPAEPVNFLLPHHAGLVDKTKKQKQKHKLKRKLFHKKIILPFSLILTVLAKCLCLWQHCTTEKNCSDLFSGDKKVIQIWKHHHHRGQNLHFPNGWVVFDTGLPAKGLSVSLRQQGKHISAKVLSHKCADNHNPLLTKGKLKVSYSQSLKRWLY